MNLASKLNIKEPLNPSEVGEIIALSKQFPFWHVPTAILARHFRLLGSEKMEVATAMAAMRIPSQTELYHYVYGEELTLNQETSSTEEIDAVEIVDDSEKSEQRIEESFGKGDLEIDKEEAAEILAKESDSVEESVIEPIIEPIIEEAKEEIKIEEPKAIEKVTPDEPAVFEEIAPFTAELKQEILDKTIENEIESEALNEVIEEIELEVVDSVALENTIEETEIVKKDTVLDESKDPETLERTLEEIENLMNYSGSSNIIPETSEVIKEVEEIANTPKSNSAMDLLTTSYEITDHFSLPKDEQVSTGQDFYFWLKQPNDEIASKPSKPAKEKTISTVIPKKISKKTVAKTNPIKKAPAKKLIKKETLSKKKLSKAEILDNFIKTNPSISKIEKVEVVTSVDYSNKAGKMPFELATETLARIYEEQGNIKAAKKIYTTLMLKFPTKKLYFADRIKKLK